MPRMILAGTMSNPITPIFGSGTGLPEQICSRMASTMIFIRRVVTQGDQPNSFPIRILSWL